LTNLLSVIQTEHHSKAISSNGLFHPVIVVNGQVVGLWKRTVKKNKVLVETDFFQPPTKEMKKISWGSGGKIWCVFGSGSCLNLDFWD
jgi:hypothetical protein